MSVDVLVEECTSGATGPRLAMSDARRSPSTSPISRPSAPARLVSWLGFSAPPDLPLGWVLDFAGGLWPGMRDQRSQLCSVAT